MQRDGVSWQNIESREFYSFFTNLTNYIGRTSSNEYILGAPILFVHFSLTLFAVPALL